MLNLSNTMKYQDGGINLRRTCDKA